jgi:hypothetical protein
MLRLLMAFTFVFWSLSVLAAPMIEMRGMKSAEGCLKSSTAYTDRLMTCPVEKARIRIWCPNGKVFDRDEPVAGIAILRSICEINQLPG